MTMQWIPVADGIPKEYTVCAVITGDGDVVTAWPVYWHGARTDFACWVFPIMEDDTTVTHWLELPPKP